MRVPLGGGALGKEKARTAMAVNVAQPRRHAVHAMGTRFEVVAFHEDAALLRGAMEAAFEEVLRLHTLWSPFENSSTIAHVNRGGGEAVRVDRDTLDLLVACRCLWQATDGRFDPAIGSLMRWWGFRGDAGRSGRATGAPRPEFGMRNVEVDVDAGAVRVVKEGVELDMGAIGKGMALDRAAEILRGAGVACALLHAGTSSVLAMGSPVDGEGWRVRVGDELDAPVVELRDESLSVSRPSGRVIEVDGVPTGHVLDPRTGEPARGATLAAVVCESAAAADAWSTASLVDGGSVPASVARWAYVLRE